MCMFLFIFRIWGSFSIIFVCFCYSIPSSTDTVSTMATGLDMPNAIAFTPSGLTAYVLTDTQVLTVSVGGGATSVLAGRSGVNSFANGLGTSAIFNTANGLVVHSGTGVMYITDLNNNRIRACTALGLVSTLAGSDTAGNTDGAGSTATFNEPFGIVMDSNQQYLYVTCFFGNTLRRVEVTTGLTATIAGSKTAASTDGTGLLASFNAPTYVAIMTIVYYWVCAYLLTFLYNTAVSPGLSKII